MTREEDTCMRCMRKLDHSKSVWLEMNCSTGLFCTGGWPEEESQGFMEFGADCAKAILANQGRLVYVGRAAKSRG